MEGNGSVKHKLFLTGPSTRLYSRTWEADSGGSLCVKIQPR